MFCKRDLTGFPPLASEAVKKGETQETFIRIALLSKAKKMVLLPLLFCLQDHHLW